MSGNEMRPPGVSKKMRVALLVAVVVALVGTTAASRSQATVAEPVVAGKTLPPALGISYRAPRGTLAWFDPLSLRTLPGRKAPLGGHLGSWAFSDDRSILAIAKCSDEGTPTGIRLVNARTMRVLGDLRLSPYRGCTSSLTWLREDRLLAVVSAAGAWELVVVDLVVRRVIRRQPLPSWPSALGRTREEVVLQLGSFGEFAPARLAVVDAAGTTRIQSVDRILEGTVVDEESTDYRARTIQSGLAVDPDGRRAFLVPASGPVAEVDLATLGVSYHELDRPSLLERFWRWLVPAAQAKVMEGPVREARWLGGGMIAVSGMDYSIGRNALGEELFTATPVGVSLIDTRSWTTRMLSHEASGFAVAPGLVIAQGGRWDSSEDRGYGPGLHAFGLDGRERWRLHPGEYRWMDAAGLVGYAYVAEGKAEVVDLATGVVLGRLLRNDRHDPWPQLLAAQASGW